MSEITNKPQEHEISLSDPSQKKASSFLWGDILVVRIANTVCWIFPILILAIITQIILRKAGYNQAWLDDLQWWLYGTVMIVGFGYAITTESHVRVDIFHHNFSEKKKAKIEIFALGWLLLPFLAFMTDILFHYAWTSWLVSEGSDSANGLHNLYLLKFILPFLFILAITASIASLLRHMALISPPAIWKLILTTFPACLFVAERIVFYAFWWTVHLTKPEIHPRRISSEPLLAQSYFYGFLFLSGIIFIAHFLAKPENRKA